MANQQDRNFVKDRAVRTFSDIVYDVVQTIPEGYVATYGQVAALIGSPRSARYVGYALHGNPAQGIIPCHRVVFKNGALAPGFAFGGPNAQKALLEAEGVTFIEVTIEDDDGQSHTEFRVDMTRCQWKP